MARYRNKTYRRTAARGVPQKIKGRPNIETVSQYRIAGMTVPQMARYGAVGYNIMKGLINSELKKSDINTSTSVSTTATIVNLTAIAQGDDVGDRNGNKILLKYLRFQYYAAMNVSATSSAIRVMVVVDTENQGSAPSINDILQTTGAGLAINAPINSDDTQRFTVLFDDHIALSNTGQSISTRKHYISLNFHTSFTSSLSSSSNKNAIYLVAVSTEATNTPTLAYSSRLSFYDN